MRIKLLLLPLILLAFAACTSSPQTSQPAEKTEAPPTGTFGSLSGTEAAIPAANLPDVFADKDTVEVSISGNISASCRHSGCWMDLDMGNDRSVHVTFKDESFTVPLDAAGKNAIAQGIAIREQIPVETLRNYAREDGKSEDEIAQITQPEWVYEFVASGVLIEE